MKIIICVGICCSGKTTYAQRYKNEKPRTVIIDYDEMRSKFFDCDINDYRYNLENESLIKEQGLVIAKWAIANNYDLIISNTNLKDITKNNWIRFAKNNGVAYVVKHFPISWVQVLKRYEKRLYKIPMTEMRRQYNTYCQKYPEKMTGAGLLVHERASKNPFRDDVFITDINKETNLETVQLLNHLCHIKEKQDVYLVDIDGTIADLNSREGKDYDSCCNDLPIKNTIKLINQLSCHAKIIMVTARPESHREMTIEWLKKHGVVYDSLFMRPKLEKGEVRKKDDDVKYIIFKEQIEPYYNVLGVFDDRQRVVDMWRRIGLICYQVNYGDF